MARETRKVLVSDISGALIPERTGIVVSISYNDGRAKVTAGATDAEIANLLGQSKKVAKTPEATVKRKGRTWTDDQLRRRRR